MRFNPSAASLGLLLTVAGIAGAQDLGIKAPPQRAMVIVQNATIHPVSGPVIPNGVIAFERGTIGFVGDAEEFAAAAARVPIPVDAVRIDGTGLHVSPGLIAPYTQLGLTEIQAVPASIDIDETGPVTPEVRAAIAVNPDSTLLPVTRSNGILLAGVFPAGGLVPGRASVIRLDGWTIEDLTVDDDAGVILDWPIVRPIRAWWMERSDEEQLKEIRENLARIDTVFNTARAYHDQRAADPGSRVDLRWDAMRSLWRPADAGDSRAQWPAAQNRLYILANDVDQITSAVTWARQRDLRPVIVGGRDADLCADLLTRERVPVIINGTHVMPKRDDSPYDAPFTLPRRLADAGVEFTLSAADDTAHERNLPYNAASAVAHGLPEPLALRALTLSAARILGIDDRYGSLEPGKSATLIITTGSPLQITSRTTHAFIDGRQIDLRNKHTELDRKYRERYRQTGQIKERAPAR